DDCSDHPQFCIVDGRSSREGGEGAGVTRDLAEELGFDLHRGERHVRRRSDCGRRRDGAASGEARGTAEPRTTLARRRTPRLHLRAPAIGRLVMAGPLSRTGRARLRFMAARTTRPATYRDLEALPSRMVGEIVHGVLYANSRPAL